MVIKCTDVCVREFQKNPKAFCVKYGIKEEDVDPRLMKECKNMSVNECRELLKKSKCCSLFDFSC